MLAKIPQPSMEMKDSAYMEMDDEEMELNLRKYKTGMEMIDLKNSILDSIFQINTYYNAYKFLKTNNIPFYQKKANKKAAELFQTITALLNRIKNISILAGDSYLTGDQIFQGICDKRNSQHIQALSLIQSVKDRDYTLFKAFLEEASSSGLSWA